MFKPEQYRYILSQPLLNIEYLVHCLITSKVNDSSQKKKNLPNSHKLIHFHKHISHMVSNLQTRIRRELGKRVSLIRNRILTIVATCIKNTSG